MSTQTQDTPVRLPLWARALLPVVFVVMIILPMFGQIFRLFDLRYIETVERRTINPLPKWPDSFDRVMPAAKQFEDYLDDRFGFRSWFITTQNYMYYKLGCSATDQVVQGKDQWLLATSTSADEQYRGLDRFSDADLARFVKIMKQRQDFLAARKIPLIFELTPTEYSIYPEILPDWMFPVATTRVDQFVEAGGRAGLDIMDMRKALKAKAHEAPLYFKTDIHWNYRGAYIGYQLLMEKVRAHFPGAPVVTPDQFSFRPVKSKAMTTASLANLSTVLEEPYQYELDWRDKAPAPTVFIWKDDKWQPGNVDLARLHNRETLKVVNPGAKGPRVLIYRDSFTANQAPFLNRTFREIVYVGHLKLRFNEEFVAANTPELVIYQALECHLIHDPQAILDPDAPKPPEPGMLTYAQAITTDDPARVMTAGAATVVSLTAENTGNWAWPDKGLRNVRLTWRWLDTGTRKVLPIEGKKAPLPRRVNPAEKVDLKARVQAPPTPGDYILRFTLVHERAAFFDAKGADSLNYRVKVVAP